MQRLQAFKFKLVPDGAQQRAMRRSAGSCRFVYNKALAAQKANHEAGGKFIDYVTMAANLPVWKRQADTAWLNDAPSQSLQHALKDLERAYKNFFAKRAAFPKFKRRGDHDSFRYPDPKQFKLDEGNARIKLPKLGWVRYRKSRDVLGAPRNVTVSHSCGHWYISIQTERAVDTPPHASRTAIGIDLGVTRFATMSDGAFIAPLNGYKKHEARLRRYQHSMSRKVKFSANWKKAKAKVQSVHRKIGNCRRDFLHKASTALVRDHALIAIEDLHVKNMSRSATGTVDQPGRNVTKKRGLNRSIRDQGWGEFRRQLVYKGQWVGATVVAVSPHHTSQTCPACGYVSADNRATRSKFECVACGYENHADHVGAINILERGHRLLACGESVQLGHSAKQEPTDAITRETIHV
jgi:putative transposase